jgi:hypothetical protein
MKQIYAFSKAKAPSNEPTRWPTNTGKSFSNSPNSSSNFATKCGYNAFPPGLCTTGAKTTKTEPPSAPSAPLASKVAYTYPRRCTTSSSNASAPPAPPTYVRNQTTFTASTNLLPRPLKITPQWSPSKACSTTRQKPLDNQDGNEPPLTNLNEKPSVIRAHQYI